MKSFEDVFGAPPAACAQAPGRVNLLGEHTDYNEGFVLPIAIPQKTQVCASRSNGPSFRLYSDNLGQLCEFSAGRPPEAHFATYVYGCIMEFSTLGAPVPPLDLHVSTEVPIGAGLSSSAALEVATLRALRTLLSTPADNVAIAQMAQRAENLYAGVASGIMDQMASSLAGEATMLYLDTRTLERKSVPLPEGAEVLVMHSGIARSLASSAYDLRNAECRTAARMLGVSALRDARLEALSILPSPFLQRARHVVNENRRVMEAAAGVSAERFGALMNESHASLRDDYEVSVPALDLLVSLLQGQSGVYGAKLTGAGFGGACVALCRVGSISDIANAVLRSYEAEGLNGSVLVPAPG